jgi:hypothetical protein
MNLERLNGVARPCLPTRGFVEERRIASGHDEASYGLDPTAPAAMSRLSGASGTAPAWSASVSNVEVCPKRL